MEILNVIIMVVLIFIIYQIVKNGLNFKSKGLNGENMTVTSFDVSNDTPDTNNADKSKNKSKSMNVDKHINRILKRKRVKSQNQVNEFFEEKQFHNDYRDTIDAFSMLIPNKKVIFNPGDIPVRSIAVSPSDVMEMSRNFVNEINKIVKTSIGDSLTANNWHNSMPQQETKEYKSGWDKQMNELGLPGSIYVDPAKKAPLSLIAIDHVEKYETDNEVKFVIFLILQKQGVADQIIIRLGVILDQNDVNLDRDFFDKGANTYKTAVKIEDIFIMGFLSRKNFGTQSAKEDWYNFDGMGKNREFSQKEIINKLIEKKQSLAKEYNDI